MRSDDYAEEQERERQVRSERIRIEIYRAAALLYAHNTVALSWSQALLMAISLWNEMDTIPGNKRPY